MVPIAFKNRREFTEPGEGTSSWVGHRPSGGWRTLQAQVVDVDFFI